MSGLASSCTEGPPRELSFWQLERHPSEATALVGEAGRSYSYAAVAQAADDAAGRLPGQGRDIGFILFESSPAAIFVYLGSLRSRSAVPLLLPARLNPALLEVLIETYAPAWVAAPGGISLPNAYRAHFDLDGFEVYARATGRSGPVPHTDCALLLSTSGSTGSPKLVRLSYSGLAHNAASIAQYLELGPTDRAITTLPLAYSFGMSVLNSHLAVGGSLALTDKSLLSREFWQLAAGAGITSLSGVPSTYDMLRRLEIQNRAPPQLRALCQAGGRLSEELTRHFLALARDRGWSFFVMYGQTEASPRISYVPPARLPEKIGSIGVPVPGGALSIAEDTGELVYRGRNVMMGYAISRDDVAKPDECGGVLRTGDLGRRDQDGFFYLTGRLKRFVKMSGNRVNLDEIEVVLASRLGVAVACAGEDERLVVALTVEGSPTDGDIRGLVRELFDIYAGAVHVRRVARFPQLDNGKVDYAAIDSPPVEAGGSDR